MPLQPPILTGGEEVAPERTTGNSNSPKFIRMYVRHKYLAHQACDFTNIANGEP